MFIAISAAGAFRSDDGAVSWQAIDQGLTSRHIPDPTAEVGRCVHRRCHAPVAARRAFHAEALGRDALRRRRWLVARGLRKSTIPISAS